MLSLISASSGAFHSQTCAATPSPQIGSAAASGSGGDAATGSTAASRAANLAALRRRLRPLSLGGACEGIKPLLTSGLAGALGPKSGSAAIGSGSEEADAGGGGGQGGGGGGDGRNWSTWRVLPCR